MNDLFQIGTKRKRNERNYAEITSSVMNVMNEFEGVVEEDADLYKQEKPVNKLKKLSLLTEALSKYVINLSLIFNF